MDDARSQGEFDHQTTFQREMGDLKRRLVGEATDAIGMLEASIEALFALDAAAGRQIRRDDDRIDREEVAIEEECLRLLALHQPVAHDFRFIAYVLKVNQDVERIADNACSIAKALRNLDETSAPPWPTSLRELAQRVPLRCHELLRAMRDEDADAARELVRTDKTIDRLERNLFAETTEMMRANQDHLATGLMVGRLGRTLERVSDLLSNIAEHLIYLDSGEIVRHARRKVSETEPDSTA